ncbi:MAG TPA: OsmC family protein [Tepidisphaeraceae bacterium]|jgi:osmotically inducible protein OsmC|nr:OsmC family protein [Tepidisphaeraceae bacterium]
MPTRNASAAWEGDLKSGKGSMKLGSGAFEGKFSFGSRFEQSPGTNPEELLGAAHAGCFSMAFSHTLASAGFIPKFVKTDAKVTLEQVPDGFAITHIQLTCEGNVPNIDDAKFQELAAGAKKGCPVSKALASVKIDLDAKLVK